MNHDERLDRERARTSRECCACAPEPEPGWIDLTRGGTVKVLGDQARSCPICNDDGAVPQGVKR